LSDRELPVTIYYPAGGAPGSADAPDVAARPGSFPPVVFAHGFNVSASTYAGLEHELAAGGLIVAAPDFPTSSSAFPGPPAETDIVNQARDVSFLITVLDSGAGLPPELSGHVAPTKAGVVGHSDGGTTVAEAVGNSCCADPRIGAAAVLSGDEGHDGGQWFAGGGPPLLVVQGTADGINPPALSEKLFSDATAPKLYVAITDGAHLEPYTSGPQLDAISKLLVDFLRAELAADLPFAQVLADADDPGVLSLSTSVP
jgi:predicted dienelactone hydrolase